MIEVGFFKRQLDRLACFPGRHPDIAWQELTRILHLHALTDQHLVVIIDTALETLDRFPLPTEIIAIARETRSKFLQFGELGEGCTRCLGGWKQVYWATERDESGKEKRKPLTAEEWAGSDTA